MGLTILDGAALAARRLPGMATRADAVRSRRGREPALLLVAAEDSTGRMPHVIGKQRACAAGGVTVTVLGASARSDTAAVSGFLESALGASAFDAVFVQVPLPAGVDEQHIMNVVPPSLDVDIMTAHRVQQYMSGAADEAPVTVEAALLLLDEHSIDIKGMRGVVVAQQSDFALMFSEALRRRGAHMERVIAAGAPELHGRLRAAQLVVAAAGAPGVISTALLAPHCVAIDAGYFNAGGRGDIDTTPGIHHLAGLMPVPGGIGPMTVSTLIERVVRMAEDRE